MIRSVRCRIVAMCLSGIGGMASSLPAQTLSADCNRELAEPLHAADDWASLRPVQVRKRLAPLRAAGRWSALPDSLRQIYSLPPASFSQLSLSQRAAIDAEIDSLRSDLQLAELNPSKLAAVRERFRLEFEAGPPVSYTLLGHAGVAPITLVESTPQIERRSVCWFSLAAQDLTRQAHADAIAEFAGALKELDEDWDNFMNHGYSMLPYEVLLNGFLHRTTLNPPRFQVIALHPSVGTQIVSESWAHLRESHREDVLALEPIGIVMYGSHHRSYRGASWLLTFPSASRLGTGVMLHAGNVAQLAFVIRPRDADGKRRNALMMSIDVYRYLSAAAETWKQKKSAAIVACETQPQDCVKTVLQ